jgi:membrane carboxypeptidase/penicillin-binding protein
MTDLLIDGVKNGTSKRLKDLPYQVAGKTGTVAIKNTNQNSDVYSIAYTTEHTVGVWLGNYSFQKEYNLEGSNNGGTYCTNIVKETLNGLYNNHTPKDFVKPESIETLKIDEKNLLENHTIKLAGKDCPERYVISEIFSKRFSPKEYSDIYSNFEINFNIELIDNIANVSFNALDYLIYDIYVDDGYSFTQNDISKIKTKKIKMCSDFISNNIDDICKVIQVTY